jgi:hypothetical protein
MRSALLAVLLALPAWASSTYPTDVQTHLSLSAPIPESCSLCHLNGITGTGTVNTPFGVSLRGKGATGGSNTTALNAALDAMNAANTDSDSDGVSDINELKAGTDPNVANNADGGTGGGGGTTVPPLTYGCGSNAVPGLFGLTGLLFVLMLGRRR